MIKNVLRALAGLAILAVGVFVMNGLIGMKETPPVKPRPAVARTVKVLSAAPDTLTPTVGIEGRVQALNRMTVLSEVSGMLPTGGKEFREGVRFRQGEAMLRVDDAELRANLVGQRSQWLQLLAGSLADIAVDFPDRAAEWQAYVSNFNVERTLSALPEPATDRERLYLTGRGIVAGYHTIRSAEERLDKFSLKAPFTGVVTGALVQPGSMVRAGQPLGTLVGTETFEVKSAVHARHLERLAEGNPVRLMDESGAVVATGRVARISGTVDPATQSASVYSEVQAVDGGVLRDGRYLSGTVSLDPMTAVVALDAALLEGMEDSEVFVVRDGRLETAAVDVVHRDADKVLIRGLEPGTPLLAESISGAYAGLLVEVVNP
jgi:multidrug efflux pump subunit AcrA (membrane-fusion protein)